MRVDRAFTTSRSEQVSRGLIADHLERKGYKQLSSEPSLVYERGSRWRSWLSFSPKHWKAVATIQTEASSEQATDVVATLDIDTTGQVVIERERQFWESEIDGLVAAASGFNADTTMATKIEHKLRLERQSREGANWFFWIAGLSLVNSIMWAIGSGWNFLIGLGATQIIDGFAAGLAYDLGPESRTIVQTLALVLSAGVSGILALFGFLARKGYQWSFIVGMVLYALDGLIFLAVRDFVSTGFHVFGLYWIFMGFRAGRKLRELEEQAQSLAP